MLSLDTPVQLLWLRLGHPLCLDSTLVSKTRVLRLSQVPAGAASPWACTRVLEPPWSASPLGAWSSRFPPRATWGGAPRLRPALNQRAADSKMIEIESLECH